MKRLVLAIMLTLGAAPALAASQQAPLPLVTGPQDPSQINATLNGVIQSINGILGVLVPATPGVTATNFVSLVPGGTGFPAKIALGAGGDSNGSIAIVPNASGDIVLFNGNTASGNLRFANSAAFIPVSGFSACPGVYPNKKPLGVRGTVNGFIVVKDWLGNTHGIPAC